MGRYGRKSGTAFLDFDIDGAALIGGVTKLLKKHGMDEAAAEIESGKRFGADETTLAVRDSWPDALIADLAQLFTGNKKLRDRALALLEIRRTPSKAIVKNLRYLPAAITEWLKKDAIDEWVYTQVANGEASYAYIVTECRYEDADPPNQRASVWATLKANRSKIKERGESQELYERTIGFSPDDTGKTVTELMLKHGLLHETADRKDDYEKSLALFQEYQPQEHKQFLAHGLFIAVHDREYDSDSRWESKTVRVVNDEDLLRRGHTPFCDTPIWGDNSKFHCPPVHPTIMCFDLETHTPVWIHAAKMTPYVYNPALRDKLILPTAHRDLIEVLTADLDVFMEDIIVGKSGGTAILCHGAPGLGKTLTAEVYAEVIERPLYRVHSGQLGITVKEVEANLEEILKRAQRWGAVLLIDEADVYIRRRGDNLEQNAVVAGFLRTLEYFSGLLFLTTNRGDEVDDAIASRMIAMVKYEPPNKHDACSIWRVLSEEFKIKLTPKLVAELQEMFPKASGRDIKNLLKLTAKYAKRKSVPLDIEAFRICSMFRGL